MTTQNSSPAPSQTQSQPATPASDQAAPAASAVPAAPAQGTAANVETKTTPAATPDPAPAAPVAAALTTGEPPKPAEPAAAAPPAAPVIPEAYEFVAPKGDMWKDFKFDPALATAMSPAFKAAELTQDKATQIVQTFLEYQKGAPARMLARDLEVTMKDPAIGGMNWGKTQGQVNEALAAFTTPEFRQKLERWGIANDLEFVRVFASIGRAMRGDTASTGHPTTAGEMSMADRMYSRAKKVA